MTHEEFIKKYLPDVDWYVKNGVLYIIEGIVLWSSDIKSFPDNLHIDGWLDLWNSQIKSLPNGLYVGGFLDIRGSNIRSFPNDIVINGFIYSNSQVTMTEQIQLNILHYNSTNFNIIKNPTEKVITMQKLLWSL